MNVGQSLPTSWHRRSSRNEPIQRPGNGTYRSCGLRRRWRCLGSGRLGILNKNDGRRHSWSRSSGRRNEKLRNCEDHRRENEQQCFRDLTGEHGSVWNGRWEEEGAGSSEGCSMTNGRRRRSHPICRRSTEEMDGVVEVSGPGSENSSKVGGSSSCCVLPEDPRNKGERGAGPASSLLDETEMGVKS